MIDRGHALPLIAQARQLGISCGSIYYLPRPVSDSDLAVMRRIDKLQPRNRNTAWSRQMRFDMICEANHIEYRLTKPNHPRTNGQVERMNRTIKEAAVKRFHYESRPAPNASRRLHGRLQLRPPAQDAQWLTSYEYIAKIWTSEPDRFIVNPIYQMPD